MPDEEKYTLQEAQKILAKRECKAFGHETQERSGDGTVYEIYCERCGEKWFDIGVVKAEQAKAFNEGVLAMSKALQGGPEPVNPYEAT